MGRVTLNFRDENFLNRLKNIAKERKIHLSQLVEDALACQLNNQVIATNEQERFNCLFKIMDLDGYYSEFSITIDKCLKHDLSRKFININVPDTKSKLWLNVIYQQHCKQGKLVILCKGQAIVREMEFSKYNLKKNLLNFVDNDLTAYNRFKDIDDEDVLWGNVFEYIQNIKNEKRELIFQKMNLLSGSQKKISVKFVILTISPEILEQNLSYIERIDFNSINYYSFSNEPQPTREYRFWIRIPFDSHKFPLSHGAYYVGVLRSKTIPISSYKLRETEKAEGLAVPAIIKSIQSEAETVKMKEWY